ncbi:hypothetical protein L2E82_46686 [Cichorium intybus]|uniref:Uncharacterized protein n=1 Tax=Cichorium intybus TaxID=13427 RepID=A0ACB8YUN3_CICIN|nr:hypothetical protein L2E82_46686 [Cichorium intybus]
MDSTLRFRTEMDESSLLDNLDITYKIEVRVTDFVALPVSSEGILTSSPILHQEERLAEDVVVVVEKKLQMKRMKRTESKCECLV